MKTSRLFALGVLSLLASVIPLTGYAQGVRFSQLTSCPGGSLVFLAQDSEGAASDTLCLRPQSGELQWIGGPVRSLARSNGRLFAATRLGLLDMESRNLHPWQRPIVGLLPEETDSWPSLKTPLEHSLKGVPQIGKTTPFPERYLRLADGTLVFLVDAANPHTYDYRLHDLHTRIEDKVEWRLNRNLEVREWVLSPDSLSWAVVGRLHLPDYGGSQREVVIAGKHGVSHTFSLGTPRSVFWDEGKVLWIWTEEGDLYRLHPQEGAWGQEKVDVKQIDCPCPPNEPEGLWAWTLPQPYAQKESALAQLSRMKDPGDGSLIRTWLSNESSNSFRPCWGAYLTEAALRQSLPSPPVPGAVARKVAPGTYAGTVAQVRVPENTGIATLHQVDRQGGMASEIWWRFNGGGSPVRMVGPWMRSVQSYPNNVATTP